MSQGVNISPYFLDACQGKNFGFDQIQRKILRCKLENSTISADIIGAKLQNKVNYEKISVANSPKCAAVLV